MEPSEAKFIPESSNENAEEFLQEFKELVYPTYASFGFTLPEAVAAWRLNMVFNQLVFVQDSIDDLKDKEGWK